MKKIVVFMAFAIVLSSCSNDDDKNKEEFFNLKVGNQWVYKRYSVNETQETYSGQTDTVKVVGTETLEGNEYFRLTHTNWIEGEEEFLRVDENGHLINSLGFVTHPGTDNEYTATFTESYGKFDYRLDPFYDIIVEGENYTISPYICYYTPTESLGLAGDSGLNGYETGLGFVIKKYRFVSSATNFVEYRLVSYELN
jgi:hypothetical protein